MDRQKLRMDTDMADLQYYDDAGPAMPQGPMYSQMGMGYQSGANHPDIVRYQLECDKILEDIEHFLNGDKWDTNQRYWMPKHYQRICSERMSYVILETLRTHLDKNMTLSNLSKEDINVMMLGLNVELILLIGLNAEEFYYPQTYMKIVVLKIINPIFANAKRAEGAGERNAIKSIERVQQTIMERPMEQQGFFRRASNKVMGGV